MLQDFHISRLIALSERKAAAWLHQSFLLVSLLLILCLSACGRSGADQRLDQRTLNAVDAIFTDVARTELGLAPETASRLGLTAYAPEKAEAMLNDYSQAAFERRRLIRIDLLSRLNTRPVLPPRHPLSRDLDIVTDGLVRLTNVQKIGHGRLSPRQARPYAVDPFSGVTRSVPQLLLFDHPIEDAEDADAWLARLAALSDAYEDTRRRLIADAGAGLVPAEALLTASREALEAQQRDLSLFAELEATFANLLSGAVDISFEEETNSLETARRILRDQVIPAHQRLINEIERLEPEGPKLPGLQVQPLGFTIWNSLLDWYGTSLAGNDALHDEHMIEFERRLADLDNTVAILPEDIRALPKVDWADAIALAETEAALADATDLETQSLPLSNTLMTQRQTRTADRKMLPGEMRPQSLDRLRPTLLILNPEAELDWPDWWYSYFVTRLDGQGLQIFQNGIITASQRTPARLIYRHPSFELGWTAYTFGLAPADTQENVIETWLAAETQLLMSSLAVTDTGIHMKRWSLQDGITFLQDTHPVSEDLARFLVLTIAASPGEASARLYGQRRFETLETRARAVLGQRFDQADFETALLGDGPRPFTMVEADIERWYEGQMGR